MGFYGIDTDKKFFRNIFAAEAVANQFKDLHFSACERFFDVRIGFSFLTAYKVDHSFFCVVTNVDLIQEQRVDGFQEFIVSAVFVKIALYTFVKKLPDVNHIITIAYDNNLDFFVF